MAPRYAAKKLKNTKDVIRIILAKDKEQNCIATLLFP